MDRKEVSVLVLKKIFVVFFAFVGFLTTIKLAIIYYDSNFNPYALPSFCSINRFIDCDGVAQTTHSQFLGIPLAYWGIFLYLFIIFLVFVEKIKEIKFLGFLRVFKNPMAYISALGFVSFAISIILAGVSLFEIKKVCLLCLFTYFLNLCIAISATDFQAGILASFKVSIKDFIHTLKIRKYLIAFLSLSVIASMGLAYTSLSYCFTPQVKRYEAIVKYAKMKTNPFKISGNILGDPDAKLTVYIYTDYRCPICKAYNVITHRAAQEVSGFKMIHRNLPLDAECNKYVPKTIHEGACMMAKYSIAAENQGRFWDLNTEMFDKEPKNEDALLKIAKSMGYDTIRLRGDAHSAKTKERLNQDIQKAIDLGIDGTPTIVINEKIYQGIKPYYELKDILIKAGAHDKK